MERQKERDGWHTHTHGVELEPTGNTEFRMDDRIGWSGLDLRANKVSLSGALFSFLRYVVLCSLMDKSARVVVPVLLLCACGWACELLV